jgi:glucose/mannose transport system permease protein
MSDIAMTQASSAVGATSQAKRRRPISRDRLSAILMLLPSVVVIFIFVYGFIAWNGWASLTDWRDISPMQQVGPIRFPDAPFVGFDNYSRLFNNQRFQIDLRNNGIFTLTFLIACIVIGLGLAILLDQKIRGESFFRNVFLFPMALSFVVTGTVWRWVFLGNPLPWVIDRNMALPAVIVAAVWQMSGFTMAMFLAALRSIPDEMREAARVDGASEFHVYRKIVLPLISPIILSALIILGHISLKIFDLIYVMTGGSQTLGLATDMPSLYMFQLGFNDNLFGRAAGISMIMLAFVAIVIIPYLITSRRTESEE